MFQVAATKSGRSRRFELGSVTSFLGLKCKYDSCNDPKNINLRAVLATFAAMARIMAIDFGSKRTGLAVTDPSQIIATALETVPTHQLFDYLKNYISKENVECFVVGDPRRLNNEMSETTHLTNQFVNKLKREIPGIPVKRIDERYTSIMAAKSLIESGQSRKTRQDKSVLDKISATILLQNYLSTLPPKNL